MRTYAPKPQDFERAWHVVDADGLVLGRLASEVARILRGKHRPYVAPYLDTGDHVIVVNAAKVVMTAGKARRTMAYRHSGYPGGLSERSFAQLLEERPEEVVRQAIRGMLPKNAPGPPDADQAQGLRRGGPSPRRAVAAAPRAAGGPPGLLSVR